MGKAGAFHVHVSFFKASTNDCYSVVSFCRCIQHLHYTLLCSVMQRCWFILAVDFCFRYNCRPVLNAIMKQTFSAYQVTNSLGGRDDQNPTRFSLNFRHVALAYQRYSEGSYLLAENQHERQRRLKACTEVIGAVVSQVLSDFKASPNA
jgi:hypothetical protein